MEPNAKESTEKKKRKAKKFSMQEYTKNYSANLSNIKNSQTKLSKLYSTFFAFMEYIMIKATDFCYYIASFGLFGVMLLCVLFSISFLAD